MQSRDLVTFQTSEVIAVPAIPAIETTSSTVNLSQEEATPANIRPAETKSKPAVLKSALKDKAKGVRSKTAPGQVVIKAVAKKTGSGDRPKTVTRLASRQSLRRTLANDHLKASNYPDKRRSVSASRAESTPKSVVDMNVKPVKRKDLVTPTMGPPRSPGKRPRPLLRVAETDESFREKRHRSCDPPPKTPG